MIYTFVDSALWYLQREYWDSSVEDQVLALRKELRFMRTYLIYLSISKGIRSGSNSIMNSFDTAIINSTKDLSSACCGSQDEVGPVVCYMLEKVKECKQEIRKAYAIFWNQPWESNTPPIIHSVMEFVESVLKNLKDLLVTKCLVPFMKENIESLEEKLRFIQKLIGKIEKQNVVHRKMGAFFIYVQVVATSAACLAYFCWFDEMDETHSSRIDNDFSDLMQLIKPCTSDRVDIYIELLKALESKSGDAMMDEVEGFVDFLLGNSVACIKDQIVTIREELVYLIKFLMELPDHCSDDLGQISADIKGVVKGAGLLHINKIKVDRVEEMTIWLSTLLHKMNLIKEKISGIRLQSCEESVAVPMKEETAAHHEGMEFQRTFSADLAGEKKNDHKVTSLTYSIQGKKLTEDMVRIVDYTLFPLLKSIEVIRVDMYARDQQSHRAGLVYSFKDQTKSLQEDIKGIESDFKDGKLFLAHTQDLAPESSSLISSFHVEKALDSSEGRVNEVPISVFELTDIIKAELFLMELRIDEVGLLVHMKDQAENLQEGLRFLRSFLMKPPRKYNEENELMLRKSEAMAIEASSVIFSFYENAMKENIAMEMNLTVSELLEKIELLKMETRKVYLQVPLSLHSNLPDGLVFISSLLGDVREVLNYKDHSIDFVKPQIEMLHAELESLKCFLEDTVKQHNEHEELTDLWTCITDVAYEAEYMIDSSVFGDDPEWYFMLWLPIAMKKIKLIKSRIKEIYDNSMSDVGVHNENTFNHQPSRDYNPAVAEVVIGLDDQANLVINLLLRESLGLDILSIEGPPGIGKTTLAKKVYYSPRVSSHFRVKAWCTASQEYQMRDLLYDILRCVTEVTDSEHDRITDEGALRVKLVHCLTWVRYLIVIDNLQDAEALDDLRRLLPDDNNGSKVLITSQFEHLALHNENTFNHQPSRDYNLAVAEVVIGLDAEANLVFNLLVRESLGLDIVSIVGPPGLGKTTLAKKVYYSPQVSSHFGVKAWCSASQEYQMQDLLYDILSCVTEVTDSEHARVTGEEALRVKLFHCLKWVRYLIVIDNLQDAEAVDDLRRLLPDDNNGSRVLITSQFRHLALHANPYSEPYPLCLLSMEEGWMLLQEKIFPRATFPLELLQVGKQISAKCRGIPLVLVLMAGLLARTDKTLSCWTQIAKSSRADSFMDLLDDVFELCYRHLPDPLKSCLLFFGAFPVNKEISVSKLFRLWISEGFLPKNELKSREDLAEEYLADLIGRNLVTIGQRSSRNGIKTCRIHDLLWNLCTKKAKKENFLQLTHWSHLSNPSAFEGRRICLCIGAGEKQFIMSRTPCVRCLLCSVSGGMYGVLPQDVDFISNNFKLLRVLDLECINIGNSFPTGLLLLELLRYLAVKGGINSISNSLANLWNLETLIVKGFRGEIALPNSFWKMQKLRHVHILPGVTFNSQDDELDYSDVQLDNLFSLSTPVILNGNSSMENAMRRLCTLRKLKCIVGPSWDSLKERFKFPVLDCLCQLESLKISPTRRQSYLPCEFSFPLNLKKLTLSNFGLSWSEISNFEMLPNLEILKLLYGAFKGEKWEAQEVEFPNLKYLKLDSLDIAQWEASDESFPCLERLVIHRCRQLEEIPTCVVNSPMLTMIDLQSCGRFVISVTQIPEDHLVFGDDDLNVITDDETISRIGDDDLNVITDDETISRI